MSLQLVYLRINKLYHSEAQRSIFIIFTLSPFVLSSTWLKPVAIPLIYLAISGVAVQRTLDLLQHGCVKELHKSVLVQRFVTPEEAVEQRTTKFHPILRWSSEVAELTWNAPWVGVGSGAVL